MDDITCGIVILAVSILIGTITASILSWKWNYKFVRTLAKGSAIYFGFLMFICLVTASIFFDKLPTYHMAIQDGKITEVSPAYLNRYFWPGNLQDAEIVSYWERLEQVKEVKVICPKDEDKKVVLYSAKIQYFGTPKLAKQHLDFMREQHHELPFKEIVRCWLAEFERINGQAFSDTTYARKLPCRLKRFLDPLLESAGGKVASVNVNIIPWNGVPAP